MDKKHLIQRRSTWYARLVVPTAHRAAFGRRQIVMTLGTTDLRVARQRRHAALARMHSMVTQATRGVTRGSPTGILADAQSLLDEVNAGRMDREDAEDAFSAAMDRTLDAAAKKYGVDPEDGHPRLPESDAEALRLANRVFAGERITLMSDAVERYLEETKARVTAGTLNAKTRQLKAFTDWLKADVPVTSITRQRAGRYVNEQLLKRGAAVKTTRGELSSLSAFWNWLETRGEVSANVWLRLSGTVRESTRGTGPKRRPWTDKELESLLTRLAPGDVLIPLTVLGAFTGCRLNELAEMRVSDVTGDSMKVREGKSAAAVRTIPLTPAIRALVARLAKTSPDGYVLPGLLSGGTDNRRSHMVGKRFGYAIRALGFDDPALTFHTLRNAFIQRCEEAGVPQTTAALLAGHTRQGQSYGGYSKGVSAEVLQAAAAKVTFGSAVDSLARSLGKSFALKTRSRRRSKRAA
jgi:integrase